MPHIVIACILLLLGLLLSLRVRLFVTYDGRFSLKFRYLFFTLRIKYPKAAQTKEKAAKAKRKADIKKFLENLGDIMAYAKKIARSLRTRLRIDRLKIRLIICEEDAAQTAVRYGEACALVYTVAGFLANAADVRRHEITVQPRFGTGAGEADFECVASMRLCSMLRVVFLETMSLLFNLVKKGSSKFAAKGGAYQ